MTTPVRIVVADDHNLFRAGLIELLDSVPEFAVVGDVATGDEAVNAVGNLEPDVLILDIEMPGPGAAAVIGSAAQVSPATRVVVLTMHDDTEHVRSLIEAGASAYLIKSASRNELVAAINSAVRPDSSVLLALPRATAVGLARGIPQADEGPLSRREQEVLALVAGAKTNREIARTLFISEATVKRHLANAYSKLGASSRMEAVQIAVARGIIGAVSLPGPGAAR